MISLSHTEENYLKELYHLTDDDKSVTTNALAASMNTSPASVNDMLKRLDQKGMLSHVKYKGSTITEQGRKTAVDIIRKHRLWEVFLVEKLHFQWDEVHEIAEQLEHIKSPLLTQRLDAFLGNPKLDPHGDPIPDENGEFHIGPQAVINDLVIGEKGILVAVTNDESALLQHLDQLGIRLGILITVRSKSDFDESLSVEIQGKEIFLSKQVAEHLMVSKQ